MTTNGMKSGIDALANQLSPFQNYGRTGFLSVKADDASDERQSFLFFGRPFPPGATVIEATLRLYTRGDWSGGPHTLTGQRISTAWKESTITWDRRPAVDGATVDVEVPSGVAEGTLVELDVTTILQAVAAGSDWFGLRLTLDTLTAVRRFYSSESLHGEYQPELVVVWSRAPQAPNDLRPAGQRATSLAKPVLAWAFRDREGDDQSELQVQIDALGDFGAPDFDSGWVVSSDSQLDLTTTAFGGFTDGQDKSWRVRVKDEHGLESPWSDVAETKRRTKGVLTVENPSGGSVNESAPAITTKLTGRDQRQIRHILEEDDGTGRFVEVYRRRRVAAAAGSGAEYSIDLPEGVIRRFGRDYRLTVDSWDDIARQATPGDPVYTRVQETFELVRTASITSPTNLAAVVEGGGSPGIVVTWDRAAVPDYFALIVDDVIIDDRIDPAEASVGGTSYRLIHYSASPTAEHTIEIAAVVANGAGELRFSDANLTVDITPVVYGIWLIDTEREPAFFPLERGLALESRPSLHVGAGTPAKAQVTRKEPANFEIGESAAGHNPIGARVGITITDSLRGYEGGIAGAVRGPDHIAAFRAMKGLLNRRPVRLVLGHLSIPVNVGKVSISPTPYPLGNGEVWEVTARVYQVGEFDIEVPR